MLLPHLKNAGAEFLSIATASGVAAHDVGRKYGFARAVSGGAEVISDPDVNLVVIGTRHDSHAELAQRALAEGRHVFVEKPLALNDLELEKVMAAAKESRAALMVGFNRRFSPLAREAKEFFAASQGPLSILYRVNAGRVPPDHWLQDHHEGGGRIVGEVCHFVDLMQYLIGAPPVTVFAESVNSNDARVLNEDSVFVTLGFADGSNGCIAYVAEGDKSLTKERVEIFGGGQTFVIDDFRTGSAHAAGRQKQTKLRSQDKGQADYMRSVCSVVKEGLAAPITLEELEATSRATFRILDSLRNRERVPI
jgi:polar amino acid transport system substrate-binding protein